MLNRIHRHLAPAAGEAAEALPRSVAHVPYQPPGPLREALPAMGRGVI
jgi:hypothetical protein